MDWRLKPFKPETARRLADQLGQPLAVGCFLAARGFQDEQEVRLFIGAGLADLPSPLSLPDMDKAVGRLLEARRRGERVAVCGDYDADGLTATALLQKGLTDLGHEVVSQVPHRLTDGYGLKPRVMEELAARGVKVVVTVDNGVADVPAARTAQELGLDLIITDHHRLPPELPPALAIINPHRSPVWAAAPLAGVGVAFMVLAALKKFYREAGTLENGQGPAVVESLGLVAIGTIADLAPLTGANRILVRQGLNFLAASRRPGLWALKQICRVEGQNRIFPRDVGFRLAPRLNAAGRLGSAEPALELLLCEDAERARGLAAQLEELNRARQAGQADLCAEALERLEAEVSPDARTVVLAGDGWPRGLLGLAAARVAETTRKPTILFSLEDGQAVGSGRSAGGFHLYQALNQLRHLFTSFGGHAQAAGLTLPQADLPEFQARFERLAQESGPPQEETLWLDAQVGQGDLPGLAAALAALEPFGPDHPAPVVQLSGARIIEARPTDQGGDRHLKLIVSDGLSRLTVVGWGLVNRLPEVCPSMDLALTLEFGEYRGQTTASWRLVDFVPRF